MGYSADAEQAPGRGRERYTRRYYAIDSLEVAHTALAYFYFTVHLPAHKSFIGLEAWAVTPV